MHIFTYFQLQFLDFGQKMADFTRFWKNQKKKKIKKKIKKKKICQNG